MQKSAFLQINVDRSLENRIKNFDVILYCQIYTVVSTTSISLHSKREIVKYKIKSTLVISKSKGPSKTLRDIRTSTYQIYSIEEKNIRTTTFHKRLCNLTPIVRNIY